MGMKYLDTYALVKMHDEGLDNSLLKDAFLCDLTLAEYYNVLLRRFDKKTADWWVRRLEQYSLPVQKDVLVQAILFRFQNKKKKFSIYDAVGYLFAMKHNMKFVTGDKAFKGMKNVKFIGK